MATPNDAVDGKATGIGTVSVVIPTNRGGIYLAAAVASVRDQERSVHEIILVDDGSPPPGLAAVAGDLGVSYIRQTASGIAAARNSGVSAATGEWIAFLDDDDVWHPSRLRLQFEALSANPEAIGSYTGGWYMDSEGRRFGADWSGRPVTSREMLSGAGNFPRITTLLVKRTAYERAGGCVTAMEPSEDNDLILRLIQAGELAGVDHSLVGYRRHGGNVTSRTLSGRAASRRVILRQLRAARARGDREMASLLTSNFRTYMQHAASDNVTDLIGAIRRHEWSYAGAVAWWAMRVVPGRSLTAVRDRLSRHSAVR